MINCDDCSDDSISNILSLSDKKSIVLINDSILHYNKILGGLSSVIKIKYHLEENKINMDSLDINGGAYPEDLKGIIYSLDSLTNVHHKDVYYNRKYIDKVWPKMKK